MTYLSSKRDEDAICSNSNPTFPCIMDDCFVQKPGMNLGWNGRLHPAGCTLQIANFEISKWHSASPLSCGLSTLFIWWGFHRSQRLFHPERKILYNWRWMRPRIRPATLAHAMIYRILTSNSVIHEQASLTSQSAPAFQPSMRPLARQAYQGTKEQDSIKSDRNSVNHQNIW